MRNRILRRFGWIVTLILPLYLAGCGWFCPVDPRPTIYSLDNNASGAIETTNNIVNMTVVSKDANDLKAEYRAGFSASQSNRGNSGYD